MNKCTVCGKTTYHQSGKCNNCRSFKCSMCGKKVTYYYTQKRNKCSICYIVSGDQYRDKITNKLSKDFSEGDLI